MFRSLHMKLVLIMVLLILSLMTVVGAFLMNSVVRFYLDDFYAQMQTVFGDQAFLDELQTPTQDEVEGNATPVDMLQQILNYNMGPMGIDNRTRTYYILDSTTGAYLAGSNEADALREKTPNLNHTILTGEVRHHRLLHGLGRPHPAGEHRLHHLHLRFPENRLRAERLPLYHHH